MYIILIQFMAKSTFGDGSRSESFKRRIEEDFESKFSEFKQRNDSKIKEINVCTCNFKHFRSITIKFEFNSKQDATEADNLKLCDDSLKFYADSMEKSLNGHESFLSETEFTDLHEKTKTDAVKQVCIH